MKLYKCSKILEELGVMLRNHCWKVIEQISEIYHKNIKKNIFNHFRYLAGQLCLLNTQ